LQNIISLFTRGSSVMACPDALLSKVGIVKVWWEEGEDEQRESINSQKKAPPGKGNGAS
jgi:hypothetical protein